MAHILFTCAPGLLSISLGMGLLVTLITNSLHTGLSRSMSLTDHCLVEIVLHLEDYSNEELCILPRSLRQDLLTRLPIPDLCKFEGTSVTDGVDMEEVWYSKCLLDVNVHPAKNVQEKSPARCAEYGAWQSWVSGCMSTMLPTDSNKKPWREYYFSARFGRILGSLNFETL